MNNILRLAYRKLFQKKLPEKKEILTFEDISDDEKKKIYLKYLKSQTKYFRYYLQYINEILGTLKISGLISEHTKMCARIKSFDSANKNDSKKALDDIFGIEINFATEEEEVFVVELLKRTLCITKEKIHNKSNGYVAHHYSGYPNATQKIDKEFYNLLYYRKPKENKPQKLYLEYISKMSNEQKRKISKRRTKQYFKKYAKLFDVYGMEAFSNGSSRIKGTLNRLENLKKNIFENISDMDDDNIPIIEFQFKTLAVAREAQTGTASHEKYKPENLEKIQNEYYTNPKALRDKLPIMYESDIDVDYETGEIIKPRLMKKDEVLKHLYPSIMLEPVEDNDNFNRKYRIEKEESKLQNSQEEENQEKSSMIEQNVEDERVC